MIFCDRGGGELEQETHLPDREREPQGSRPASEFVRQPGVVVLHPLRRET